jgi:glyoxylate carboligase
VNVREATFAVMRQLGMTTIFGNPGSTEIPFLTDLPDDLEFVLALHEGSLMGLATGYAIRYTPPAAQGQASVRAGANFPTRDVRSGRCVPAFPGS